MGSSWQGDTKVSSCASLLEEMEKYELLSLQD